MHTLRESDHETGRELVVSGRSRFMTEGDQARIARERVVAELPWWWREDHRERVMREVEQFAIHYAAWQANQRDAGASQPGV